MNSNPLISIIVPCFNDGKYINECINSIHLQNYENYEIIIVNDGSTDKKTNEIIDAISHNKIKVIQTQNQGPAKARNLAIKNSCGKYILPLDADDKAGKVFIREAIEILEQKPNIKIVNCDVKLFGTKKGYIKYGAYSIQKMICENIIVSASVFRREDFDKTKGYNPNMKEGLEDWDFWLSILEKGGDVYKIDKPEIFYRVKKGSRNNSLTSENLKRLRYQIYTNHKALYSKYLLDPSISFEYQLIKNSKEYRLGKILLTPIRFIYKLWM
ncbi:MAG: glycosyltransferase family A protein [Bacteroidales bacterium]|nr:glycosyltransferase family A protein [Bacteroidales bacterium]